MEARQFDPYYEWYCTDCRRAEECKSAGKPICKTFTHYGWRDGTVKSWKDRWTKREPTDTK